MLRALKSSLKHRGKHVLQPSQLYEDQALERVKPCLQMVVTIAEHAYEI